MGLSNTEKQNEGSGGQKSASQQDLASILQHMENLQTKSENSISTLITQTVENSQKKLTEVDIEMKDLHQKVEDAMNEIKKVEQDATTEREELKNRIKVMETEITTRDKNTGLKLQALREEMMEIIATKKEDLEKQKARLQHWEKKSEGEMDEIRVVSYGNSNMLRQHADQIESVDNRSRSNNLVFEGINEKDNAATDEQDLCDLVKKTIPGFDASSIQMTVRLGKERKGKKRPRPLLVALKKQNARDQLMAKAVDIRKNSGSKFVSVNRDQNENGRRRHALVKACFKLLQQNKYPGSMKGSTIMYNNK